MVSFCQFYYIIPIIGGDAHLHKINHDFSVSMDSCYLFYARTLIHNIVISSAYTLSPAVLAEVYSQPLMQNPSRVQIKRCMKTKLQTISDR